MIDKSPYSDPMIIPYKAIILRFSHRILYSNVSSCEESSYDRDTLVNKVLNK